MTQSDIFSETSPRIASRAELLAAGATGRSLTRAVRTGRLLRVRRDHYALPGTDPHTVQAVRVGGRLGCISALADMGVFVFDNSHTHIHLERDASRMRSPGNRFQQLTGFNRDGAVLHWWPLEQPGWATEYRIGIFDALAQAVQCQHPWFGVAALDSALNQGFVEIMELPVIFDAVPLHLRYLMQLVDTSAQSGQETVLRMILRSAGLHYESQVLFAGIGRVDFLVEGCLVVEADSRRYHSDWAAQLRDRKRDLQLAAQGIPSLRPAYQHTMFEPGLVLSGILGGVAACRKDRMILP